MNRKICHFLEYDASYYEQGQTTFWEFMGYLNHFLKILGVYCGKKNLTVEQRHLRVPLELLSFKLGFSVTWNSLVTYKTEILCSKLTRKNPICFLVSFDCVPNFTLTYISDIFSGVPIGVKIDNYFFDLGGSIKVTEKQKVFAILSEFLRFSLYCKQLWAQFSIFLKLLKVYIIYLLYLPSIVVFVVCQTEIY